MYRYSIRQDYIPYYCLLFVYILFSTLFLWKNIFDNSIFSKIKPKTLYLVFSTTVIIIVFLIVHNVDGYTLNVDRWSAMDVGIKSILNGEYPYIAKDHLNQYTSNLPSLFIIGLPFYLLGNVAYLQVFSCAILFYTIQHYFETKKSLYFILLLIISPAFWWEIFCLSDLMSNVFFILCFLIYYNHNFSNDKFKKPILLGSILAFFILTRGIVLVPFVLFFFSDFWKTTLITKTKLIISGLVVFCLLIFMAIHNCENLETLIEYNPLWLQTILLPKYIVIFCLLLPFFISYKIKNFYDDFLKATIFLMILPVVIAFLIKIFQDGLYIILTKKFFDLSYLSMVFPFMILLFINPKKIKIKKQIVQN
ncbi:hypothetical protein [Flavobacterium capsici]|uniref:Uncharacterized protein n=1 Tax=Flavobacterium capsici TaxID=3075618 RepID=A0AA96F2P1_9FLAO|nr:MULTISPECIES: hypothetical protein [unclassified Flavobacterium]WNM18740.1 hypothetical protein RN608_12070 [Flavobacterium sp. PMR2A8]WNM22791.1 hypothetical protein RN605_05370 [Flavobacterium sp. PMTSA4]